MSSEQLWMLSAGVGALGLVLMAATLIWRLQYAAKAKQQITKLLQTREASAAASSSTLASGPAFSPNPSKASGNGSTLDAMLLNTATASNGSATTAQELSSSLQVPPWLESGVAKALLADEDRKLLDQAGISLRNGSTAYVISRLALAIALPLLAILLLQPKGGNVLIYAFFAFGLGLMLPKWFVRTKASQRREQVIEELPLFVDLLRLLQGVGLSIDQSLQILSTEFGSVLRILSGELVLANQLYSSGRTREQSFQRLTNLSDDDDMTAVANLLVQVDRHGGAVQEPLKEFSIRLREKRQASFKEKIGSITVKMTGVMVLTLLPALLVITAGPGFMSVIRALSNMGGR